MNRLETRSAAFEMGLLAASAGAFGLAFGVLAGQRGLDPIAGTAMSAVVYAGSAQMVALQLWDTPVPLAAVCVAVLAMNARYVLMGAALRPRLAGLSPARAYASLAIMGDGNWMLAMRELAAGRNGIRPFVLGGVGMYLAWVASTAAGHALGRLVTAPQRLGLDFTLTAFCATMVIGLWRGRVDLWPIAAAAGVAAIAVPLLPSQWHILAGGLAGSLAGAWRHESRA